MPKLAVFGDEIAKDIATQIEVMTDEGVQALELRAAEGFGVLDLTGEVRTMVRDRLADGGVEVFSIGSPLGKVPVDSPVEAEVERVKVAAEQAHFFGTRRVRVFSFFLPDRDYASHREAVMERMAAMVAQAEIEEILLCHENEGRIYGETVANCVDLMQTLPSPNLRMVHDSANFVNHGEEAFPAGYEALRPRLEYVHIKDHDGKSVQPCGEGAGRMPALLAQLKADGFDGYLSLEPHLGGGPDNFRRAARALKCVLDSLGYAFR